MPPPHSTTAYHQHHTVQVEYLHQQLEGKHHQYTQVAVCSDLAPHVQVEYLRQLREGKTPWAQVAEDQDQYQHKLEWDAATTCS